MFRYAYEIARQFTYPIILSTKTVSGRCESSIGAFVPVNADGWIVTAGHIIETLQAAQESVGKVASRPQKAATIRGDLLIDERERKRRLKELGQGKPEDIEKVSAYWGGVPAQATELVVVKGVDLGLAKLDPFDPGWVPRYPVFKDPTKGFDSGVSLCKLGFPFHTVVPTYDATQDMFNLPPGALPVPLFPLEGMFTRVAEIVDSANPTPEIPMLWLETSSPGLRGQSGGPTFDSKGTVWAIQCQTAHFDLGFDAAKVPQYLNVGHGVHPLTLFNVFDKLGVKYAKSDY